MDLVHQVVKCSNRRLVHAVRNQVICGVATAVGANVLEIGSKHHATRSNRNDSSPPGRTCVQGLEKIPGHIRRLCLGGSLPWCDRIRGSDSARSISLVFCRCGLRSSGGIRRYFFFHFWKNCQRSEWAIYMDSSGIFINPHPSFGHPPIEDDVYVIHLEFPDIASARRINDTKNLYPGSFRWLEKSRITYLELTINDKVSAALAGLLRHISTGPRSEELIIMPVLFDGKTLVVYWRNEDFSIHPTCNRALDVLREFGVAIPNDPASLDRNRSGGIAEQSRRTML